MYEELFETLTEEEVEGYLQRLEMEKPEKSDLAYLDRLIFSHQTHIVFEDLDAWLYHRVGSLGTHDLFDKIIVNRRGGYCFELNALFHALLTALGYQAYPCMCRILEGDLPERSLISHRGEIVELDGKRYFCDVGFGGPMPAGALEIAEGVLQRHHGQVFRVRSYDQDWRTICRFTSGGAEEGVMQFTEMKQSPVDFLPLHTFFGSDPTSDFVKMAFFNIRTETGSIAIVGDELSIHDGEQCIRRKLLSEEEILQAIREYFIFE